MHSDLFKQKLIVSIAQFGYLPPKWSQDASPMTVLYYEHVCASSARATVRHLAARPGWHRGCWADRAHRGSWTAGVTLVTPGHPRTQLHTELCYGSSEGAPVELLAAPSASHSFPPPLACNLRILSLGSWKDVPNKLNNRLFALILPLHMILLQ